MKITVLVDNEAADGLTAEHGLSLWMEIADKHILFDTGQGLALELNARALGIELCKTDILVLSHGHYDHTGAVNHVLSANPGLRVFCNDGVVARRYSIHPGQAPRDISMPLSAAEAILGLPPDRVQRLAEPTDILPGVGVTGPIPRKHHLEDTGGPFFLDTAGTIPDPISDDVAMWIRTDKGLIIVVGCCHSGLINTADHIQRITGETKINGIIGGLHLQSASPGRLDSTCAVLQQWRPRFVIPCHCTGQKAVGLLKERLGKTVMPGRAGMTWSV